jgi:phage shock protein A
VNEDETVAAFIARINQIEQVYPSLAERRLGRIRKLEEQNGKLKARIARQQAQIEEMKNEVRAMRQRGRNHPIPAQMRAAIEAAYALPPDATPTRFKMVLAKSGVPLHGHVPVAE